MTHACFECGTPLNSDCSCPKCDERSEEVMRKRIAELEGIAKGQKGMLDEIGQLAGFGLGETYSALAVVSRIAAATATAEREACAKICDAGVEWHPPSKCTTVADETARILARNIRARNKY